MQSARGDGRSSTRRMDTRPPVHPQHALAVYVEPLAAGRRVAVFGDSSIGLAARLVEVGARSVHVWDPDAERARHEGERAPRGVVVRALPGDDLESRTGEFDLAVVADLQTFDDPAELVAQVRALVGETGAALIAAPNPDGDGDGERSGLDYYELFDLVAREFEDVTMIAQLAFHGVALAELGEREDESPAVSVDTQLADADRSPDAFVALASQRGVRLDPYAIVELPGDVEVSRRDSMTLRAGGARAEERARVDALEEELDALRARLAEAERVARAAQRLDEALRERTSQVAQLEGALVERSRELARLADEVDRARTEAETDRVGAAQLEELAVRAERAERSLAAAEVELGRTAEAHALELARYEEALRERGQDVGRLQAELARRERMIRELVDALEEAQTGQTGEARTGQAYIGGQPPTSSADVLEHEALAEQNAQLRQKLDALALDLARREGEAQASAWTIAELNQRLKIASDRTAAPPTAAPAAGDAPSGGELASALDELDVLRRALMKEHEARVRAESGEELSRARAEIQRQAVLLEQLRDRSGP